MNELNLLDVMLAMENFRIFVYSTEIEVVSDHKALATMIKDYRSNKTFSSQKTRGAVRLLPFQFGVVQGAQWRWQIICRDSK